MEPKLKVRRKACHAVTSVGDSIVDKRVDMAFDLDSVNKMDTDTLDHIICHELQHIVLDFEDTVLHEYLGAYKSKVYRDWADANEKVCDHNAAIIVAAYRRKRDRPK